jgi:hypothetical protein
MIIFKSPIFKNAISKSTTIYFNLILNRQLKQIEKRNSYLALFKLVFLPTIDTNNRLFSIKGFENCPISLPLNSNITSFIYSDSLYESYL